MSNEPVRQITVKELCDNWDIKTPYYEFVSHIGIVTKITPRQGKFYNIYSGILSEAVSQDYLLDVFPRRSINLDETLPTIPANVAQQDHDEIQRLRAERDKLREFVARIVDDEDDFYAAGIAYYAKDAKELLKGLLS